MEGTFKKCFKCGLLLPLSEFYAHPQMGDGHLNKCKNCAKRDVHENYLKKIEDDAYVEKERARGRNKYKMLEYNRIKREKYLDASKNARRDLKIGNRSNGIELHHWNYNLPKSVIPLNRRVHKRLHLLLKIDKESKTFVVKATGEKLNTMKKHCDFIGRNFPLYTIF
jgi:hypothetical protein